VNWFRRYFGAERLPQDRTSEILGRYLDGDFIVFPMADGTAAPGDLKRIEEQYSVIFPPEFVGHVCGQFPGIYVEVKEPIWPRPKAFDVGPFWSFLYGLHTFTPCSASEDWMRLDFAARGFQAHTGLQYAPVIQIVGDADLYCVDKSGAMARYNHETNEMSPEAGDFWTVFEREIAELKSRKLRKVASG
jgi:hypothetical protein